MPGGTKGRFNKPTVKDDVNTMTYIWESNNLKRNEIEFIKEFCNNSLITVKQAYAKSRGLDDWETNDSTSGYTFYNRPRIKKAIREYRQYLAIDKTDLSNNVHMFWDRVMMTNISDYYDKSGSIIQPHKLSKELAMCVKDSIINNDGEVINYKLHDKTKIAEIIAKYTSMVEEVSNQIHINVGLDNAVKKLAGHIVDIEIEEETEAPNYSHHIEDIN